MKLEDIYYLDGDGTRKIKPIVYDYPIIAKFLKYHEKEDNGYLNQEIAFLYTYLNKDNFVTLKGKEREERVKKFLKLPFAWKVSKILRDVIESLEDDFESPIEKSLNMTYRALVVSTEVTEQGMIKIQEALKNLNKLEDDYENEEVNKNRQNNISKMQNETLNMMKIARELPDLITTVEKLLDRAK